MLLAAAKRNANGTYVGKDNDLRCVWMCALNLALHGLTGYVIWGNGLTDEQNRVYQTGFNGRGFVREVDPTSIEISSDVHQKTPPSSKPSDMIDQPSLFDE